MVPTDSADPAVRGTDRRTLRDPGAEEALVRDGFALVDVLTPEAATALAEAYMALSPPGDSGLTIDYMRPDRDQFRSAVSLLMPVWAEHLLDLAVDHRVVMTTFVAKHPGAESEMFLHDDRSYVDERRARSVTVWMPLCAVSPDIPNGGLQVIPRSHRLPASWSGSNTPDLIRPWERSLRRGLVDLTVPAGSAVVYDSRLVHASRANLSDGVRVAAVCALAPRRARLLHVVATGRRHRRLHSVDEDFFIENHPREIEQRMPSECPVIEELDEEIRISARDVAAVVGAVDPDDPAVVVPADLRRVDDPPRLEPLDQLPVPLKPASSDLRVDLTALESGPDAPGVDVPSWVHLEVLAGDASGAPLLRDGHRMREAFAGGEWGEVVARSQRDADVVVLEQGSRTRIRPNDDTPGDLRLVTVEAPVVGAGARATRAAVSLDVGTAVRLTPDGLELWNDGPGQLIVLAARATSGPRGSLRDVPGRLRTWIRTWSGRHSAGAPSC